MDFGDLRAAVQAARGQPRKVGDVVWCVLKSERREEALHYAAKMNRLKALEETLAQLEGKDG